MASVISVALWFDLILVAEEVGFEPTRELPP
jgi:hypothetical protein